MKEQYCGNFSCREDVERDYQVTLDKGVKIIYADYFYEDYSGSSQVFFKQDGKIYEVRGGHCSCYGLEGQFDPTEITKEMAKRIVCEGTAYDDASRKEVVKEIFKLK
jgi:hypothetical protein